MNIIITLPTNQIEKIEKGEKTIELREFCPLNFRPQEDVIYVCVEGKREVVGYLVIESIFHASNWFKVWEDFGTEIGMPIDWYLYFFADADKLYLYFISKFVRYPKPLGLLIYFLRYTPPESYIYTAAKYYDEEDL